MPATTGSKKASNYVLSVTAGPTYTDQKPVAVNSERAIDIDSPHLDASLIVRVQNYRGLPTGSPTTSPYFSQDPHTHDLYSLEFSFTPKQDLNGHDVVFGNDFDHPIRDKLPPGFQQAFQIVKWFIDPGLYGDVHADEPYLYGPLLSSVNVVRVGAKDGQGQKDTTTTSTSSANETKAVGDVRILKEGADGDGEAFRKAANMPADAAGRKKYYLTEDHLRNFTFEKGRTYHNDFFNPYLDFNDFALRLPTFGLIPGLTIPIMGHWDGQPLRYVLKNRATNEPLLVIIFTLIPKEHLDEQGNLKDGVEQAEVATKAQAQPAQDAATTGTKPAVETNDDDVD